MLKNFILSKFRNRPTFVFLLITYAIISIFPILVLGGISFAAIKSIIQKQTIEANIERVKQIQSSVDIILNNIEETTYALLMDNSISRIKDIDSNSKTNVDNVIWIKNLISKMKSIQLTNDMIESIYFYNADKDLIVTSNGYSLGLENFYDIDWYKNSHNVKGKGSWTGVRINISEGKTNGDNNAKSVVSFIKTAAPYFQSFNGLLVVNIDERKLNEFLCNVVGQSQDDIFIIDKQGLTITCYDTSLIGKLFDDNIMEGIGTTSSGYIVKTDKSNQQFIYYYAIASNGWIYILKSPSNRLLKIPDDINMLTICLTFLLIIVNIIVSYVLSKKVYIPIDNLLITLKNVESHLNKDLKNEFEYIDQAIKKLYEEKLGLKNFIEQNKQVIKENILKKLLNGNIDNQSEFLEQLQRFNNDLNREFYSVFILKFKDINYLRDERGNIGLQHAIVIKICESIESDNLNCMGMSVDIDKIAFIVNTNDFEMVKRFSSYLIKKINDRFGINANIIHGTPYRTIFEVSKSYKEALTALNNKILLEENSVIFYDEDLLEESEYLRYPVEIEDKIINSLKQADHEKVMQYFREFLRYIYFRCSDSKTYFENYCIRLISDIIKIVELTGHDIEEITGDDIYRSYLMNSYYLDNIERWFDEFFKNIIERVYKDKEKYMEYKECISDYIYKNYQKDISLEIIAEHINVSYSYLRKIFIKIFGCSFTYYLNMIRIEKAKELLETTDKIVYDISKAVGYNNEQSFYRNFKKFTGFTPIEYRKQIEIN